MAQYLPTTCKSLWKERAHQGGGGGGKWDLAKECFYDPPSGCLKADISDAADWGGGDDVVWVVVDVWLRNYTSRYGLWKELVPLTAAQISAARAYTAELGECWVKMGSESSRWVHCVVAHYAAKLRRYETLYIFSSIPSERRHNPFKVAMDSPPFRLSAFNGPVYPGVGWGMLCQWRPWILASGEDPESLNEDDSEWDDDEWPLTQPSRKRSLHDTREIYRPVTWEAAAATEGALVNQGFSNVLQQFKRMCCPR